MSKRKLARRIADKYSPRIYRDNGDLDSKYDNQQTVKAVRAALRVAAKIALNPYSDAVQVLGAESPLNVGAKIAKAILEL